MIKKITLSLFTLLTLIGQAAWAQDYNYEPYYTHDFQSEGLFYTIVQEGGTEVVLSQQQEPEDTGQPGYGEGFVPKGRIVIPATVTHEGTTYTVVGIDENTFRDCTELTEVVLPEGLTRIATRAFQNTAIATIQLPKSLTKLGSSAFADCTHLTSIAIPAGVTELNYGMFENCAALTKVELPNTLTFIDGNAFRKCTSLETFRIPASVTRMGNGVFAYDDNLTKLYCDFSDPNQVKFSGYIGNIFYYFTRSNAILSVPKGTKELFEEVDPWKGFARIEEHDLTGISALHTASFDVTAVAGGLRLSLAKAASVSIYQTNGACLTQEQLPAGTHQVTLARGIYVVKVGNKTAKAVVR